MIARVIGLVGARRDAMADGPAYALTLTG
jgi:hypothetical protein